MHILELMKLHKYDYTDIQPYVFSKSGIQSKVEPSSDILASPFPKFSVEIDDGYLTTEEGTNDFKISVIFCEELSPDDYYFSAIVYAQNKPIIIESHKNDEVYDSLKNIVSHCLSRLQKEKLGLFNATGRSKFKNNKGIKKIYKPKNVIYISDISYNNGISKTKSQSSTIQWKSSWGVQSHWRKLNNENSLGLDRYGNRTIKGRTWINNYRKGEGESFFKARKVK